ncbi:MAG: hypothetical protein ABUL77_03820 [Bacteroidota bacterium]
MKNIRRLLSLSFAVAALAAAPTGARADETATPPPAATSSGGIFSPTSGPFGEAHQLVYSIVSPNEFPFELSKTGDGDWHFVLRPAADYFIIRNVSVGGIVSVAAGGGSSDVGVGVRAGYNLAISGLVSFWPRAGIFYHHYSPETGPGGSQTFFDVTAPFLFHLVPHFFLGVGPMFHAPIQGGGDATYGLTAIVGGWL